MIKRALCFIVLTLSLIHAQEFIIRYSIIDELYSNENLNIYTIFEKGIERVGEIYLVINYFEYESEKKYKMTIENNDAFVTVKRNDIQNTDFYYYFEIIRKDRLVLFYPEEPAQRTSNKVKVIKDLGFLENDIVLVYPEDVNVNEDEFFIAINVLRGHKRKNLIINEKDVTKDCKIEGNLIVYIPKEKDEIIKAQLFLDGNWVKDYMFYVQERKIRKNYFSSGILLNGDYNLNNTFVDERNAENEYNASANINISGRLGNTEYKMNALIRETDLNTNRDDLNKYMFMLRFPKMSLSLGDELENIGNKNNYLRGGKISLFNKGYYLDVQTGLLMTGNMSVNRNAVSVYFNQKIKGFFHKAGLGYASRRLSLGLDVIKLDEKRMSITENEYIESHSIFIKFNGNYNIVDKYFTLYHNLTSNPYYYLIVSDSSFEDGYYENKKNYIFGKIGVDFNFNNIFFNIHTERVNNDISILNRNNFYNFTDKMGLNTQFKNFSKNLVFGAGYIYERMYYSEDKYLNTNNYSINILYSNEDVPQFSMYFNSRMGKEGDVNNDLIMFTGALKHNIPIYGIKTNFSLYMTQSVLNSETDIFNNSYTLYGFNSHFNWTKHFHTSFAYRISNSLAGEYESISHTFFIKTLFIFSKVKPNIDLTYIHKINDEFSSSLLFSQFCIPLYLNNFIIKPGINNVIYFINGNNFYKTGLSLTMGYNI